MFKQFYENIAEPQREQSWIFVIGSYILDVLLIVFLMFVVYPNGWLSPIDYATNGIISTTLIASFTLFAGWMFFTSKSDEFAYRV